MQLKEEVKLAERSRILVGNVSGTLSSSDIPIIVAAYSKEGSRRKIVHYTTLHEPGSYELLVPKGEYNIVAFVDKNRNLIYEKGEPAGQILVADQTTVPVGGVITYLDLVISKQDAKNIDFPVGTQLHPKKYKSFHSTCPGVIANIDDLLFSDDYGEKGFWSPLEFFKEIGGNVYFLEEYDPSKIPILFVHGAAGSPQNWRTFFESIDRKRYQPWFFYYPSGSNIDSMSYLLFWKLQNLQIKYKFKELYITAHSMGGLVVRSFLVNFGWLFPSITNFVSVSTPWGGEELAESGVKYSPAVIPVWRDLQPESELIKTIFEKKMPSEVTYYLFFGHKGNRNLFRSNNDKVVTLASMLDQRSQKEAKMIYGFNEDHLSILSSKQVISQYNALLADIYQKTKTSEKNPGNRLHVDFSFDLPKNLPRPTPSLLLRPVDKTMKEIWLYLGTEDSGQTHGPFPPGKYEVSVVAPAFIPDPLTQIVHIGEGTTPNVRFSMKPVGYVSGYITKKEQQPVQVGKFRHPDAKVQIQSITLKGSGISRTLTPLKAEEVRYSEYYLSTTDYTFNGVFSFFNLPTGRYELIIYAKGYEPYSEICNVKPGQYYNSMMIIELEK